MTAHLLFEQSGTFKKEFKKLGVEAYDYDIKNDFGQTDFQIDLFQEIEKAYGGRRSIFNRISKDDIVFAFFPCVRFTRRMIINFTRSGAGKVKFDDVTKFEQNITYFNEMNFYYSIISKLAIIAIKRRFKLIIENPYHPNHILNIFWHKKPDIIDIDRTRRGDNFKKPTQFWFFNCKPKNNFVIEPLVYNKFRKIENTYNKVERSIISSDYAKRFILEFVL